MKYNDIYKSILENYCKLKVIQAEDTQNYFKHRPTLSKHDKETIQESLELLKQILNILEPQTCKTMINQNEFMTFYIYEKGE